MPLTRQQMLDRSAARDQRYDGRFLIGVVSTGIFCLPSCPARRPKPENVRFFFSPEAAGEAGLRACRRCRPELYYAQRDPDLETVEAVVDRVRSAPDEWPDVEAMARAAGVSRSKLHRLVRRHYHASPVALLTAARVDSARRALIDTDWRVLDVGLAAGFESDSAFHDNFARATGMAPGAYRRMLAGADFVLQLPADFDAVGTWSYLGRDHQQVCERVAPGRAERALRVGRRRLVVELEQRGAEIRGRVDGTPPGAAAMATVHRRVWRWLGLESDVAGFARHVRPLDRWRELERRQRGLRLSQTPTVFESLVWAIVGQQVNLDFAYRLRAAMIRLCGRGRGLECHPAPSRVAALDVGDLTRRQFSRRKAEYLIDAARWVAGRRGGVESLRRLPVARASRLLDARRGVGEWTRQYVLMRGCGFADCLPVGDAGLRRALERFHHLDGRPDADTTRELMAPLSPHRTLATAHLWASLAADAASPSRGAAA